MYFLKSYVLSNNTLIFIVYKLNYFNYIFSENAEYKLQNNIYFRIYLKFLYFLKKCRKVKNQKCANS